MYNTREALAYSGKLPVQQNPAGVTPQLLDLLALQKVDADKKAAAQALAMASGQASMPTVAQGIEQQALNSARGEIAQKLGLAGLAQQQAPQGPAPQMPPQQGLEGAPSPLPESYQEGGIVAFAGTTDGSKVPKADPEAEQLSTDRAALIKGLEKFGYAAEDIAAMPFRAASQLLNTLLVRPARAITNTDIPYFPLLGGGDPNSVTPFTDRAYMESQGAKPAVKPTPTSTDERPYRDQTLATRQPGVASLAGNTTPSPVAPAPRPAAGLADAAKADMSAVPGMGSKPSGAPVMSPENIAFVQAQKDRIAREQNLDPETLAAAREARYAKQVGAGNLAAIENQKARTAGLQALYERQAAERPSNFIRGLQLIGKNPRALPGQEFEGVSEGIDKTNAGYTTQDIANQTAIDGLNIAMEKAIRENDIGGYNAAVAGLEEAKARIEKAGEQGTTMADVLERTQSQKEVNYNTVEGRKAEMAMRVREINARAAEVAGARESAEKARAFEADQKQAMALAISTATKLMEMPANMAKYKGMSLDDVALPIYQKLLTELTAKSGAPRATVPTIPPPPAGAVKKIG
jgi:hypothetical protein